MSLYKKVCVRGGTLWTEQGSYEADIWIGADGRVEGVVPRSDDSDEGVPSPESVDVIDASGLWILPGCIDAHVHFREPGLTHKEDFDSGSRAAALGGVTTVLEMPNTRPPVADRSSFVQKKQLAEGRSFVDYGLFGAAIAHDNLSLLVQNVRELIEEGAIGIKVLLGPTTGNLSAPDWGQLYQLIRMLEPKIPFVFHCEDRSVIEAAIPEVLPKLHSTYEGLMKARPRFGEILATEGVLRLAQETGVSVHIAHVALEEAVQAIAKAKRAGVSVTAETGPQYLLLSDQDYAVAGHRMKVLPPIRSMEDQQSLWQGLANGALDFVATDHAPHEITEDLPRNIWEGNFGMAGVQTMLPLLLDEAINGRCSVDEVVRWTSSAPARAFGLYPRKGSLQVGSDADLTLVDPAGTWRITRDWWQSKSENTAFWGREGLGLPILTMVRGKTVAVDGEIVADRPFGRFITREETT